MRGLLIAVAVSVVAVIGGALASLRTEASSNGEFCCEEAYEETVPSAGGSGSSGQITSYVVGAPGGGVSRPKGATGTCPRWRSAVEIDPTAQPTDVTGFKLDPDGVFAILHYRDCGEVRQYVWIRQEPPHVIAGAALRDVRTALLLPPEASTSPPGRAIVNLESWLWVADPGTISATAAIPGLAATVTATVSSTTWSFGHVDGSETTVVCEGTGVAWTRADADAPAPCGHTFASASDLNVGHPVRVTITWDIAWTATNGAAGELDPVTSDVTVLDLPVDEIQTIGSRG